MKNSIVVSSSRSAPGVDPVLIGHRRATGACACDQTANLLPDFFMAQIGRVQADPQQGIFFEPRKKQRVPKQARHASPRTARAPDKRLGAMSLRRSPQIGDAAEARGVIKSERGN